MSINEDKIRGLLSNTNNLASASALINRCGNSQYGACTTYCQVNCQNNEGCGACEKGCQSSNCQYVCEYGCESTCEKTSQCNTCQTTCQAACEKNYQCGRCEYNTQCGTCEAYQGCSTTCESSCQTSAQTNTAPTTPTTIIVPNSIKGGDTISVQWGASTDSNLSGYVLEKKIDSSTWTQIYKGSSRSFSDTVAVGAGTVQYRVKAYDIYNLESSYKTSNIITVVNNEAPIISGVDSDLGGKKTAFTLNVSVSDKDATDQIDIIAKLNGSSIKTIKNAAQKTNYVIEINNTQFNQLKLNVRNEIEISATDGKATSYRRYTFTRINASPTIELPTTNFGIKNEPFTFNFTVLDAENDNTNVRILFGDKVLKLIKNINLNEQQTFTFNKLDFAQLPAGDISIKIEATDDKGGVSAKTITFKKTINGCGYVFKKETSSKATQVIVTVSSKVDDNSNLKVSVCNNANDNSPNWEIISDSLEKIYNIKNTSKTASSWAIGVKVEIERGEDSGDSYLDAIGINFR